MSALKDQDPDYGPSNASNEKHQRIYEENARSSTARKITTIIEKEFSQEINTKEKEVLEIQTRLHRASKILHLLRYIIVADFYNRKQCQNIQNGEAKQTQIHPAIKQLIGKSPKSFGNSVSPISTTASSNACYLQFISTSIYNTIDCATVKAEKLEESSKCNQLEKRSNDTDEGSRPRKIPRYIPPKSNISESQCPTRGVRHKVRKRIIIGNISKWIPPEWREDAASHKWTMYVRGNKENPDIDNFVSKVRFFLHPSYRPNDVVEVTLAPFCLSRRGWGEFPLRVQLHFKSTLNKPMDIIHYLKLDRTYTGLQTLGSETLVDIWIYADCRNFNKNSEKITNRKFNEQTKNDCKIKQECNKNSNFPLGFSCHSIHDKLTPSDNNSDALMKQEVLDDIKVNANSIYLKKLQFYIELDHDYCGSKFINGTGKDVSIEYSSTPNALMLNKSFQEKANEITTNDSLANGSLSKLDIKEETTSAIANLLNEDNRSSSKVIPASCSKIHSNFLPLEISIPPLFEPTRSKHVLVLQNNKTIPVDLTVSCTDHANRLSSDITKPKVNLTTPHGISLLRKPSGSENINQVGNPNRTTMHQRFKLQLSKTMLLNVNSNIPVLKIVEKSHPLNDLPLSSDKNSLSESASKANNQESKQFKLSRQKIALGKDKHKLQSKKEFYEEVFKTIQSVKISNVEGLLRFIVRRMPMVTQNASDPDYRRLHPYASRSAEEFFNYSVGKRRAYEWNRAKMIQYFMKKKILSKEELWSIKEIMMWARLHGYTPHHSDLNMSSIKQQKCLPDSAIIKNISTCTEPEDFCKWLQIYPRHSMDQLLESNASYSNLLGIEVDVVNIDVALERGIRLDGGDNNKNTTTTKITVLELENKFFPFHDFVCETAREIGFKLLSEEIIPGVMYCAAGRMIMRAVECLIEDLVRTSLAKSWERCSGNGYPNVIVLEDVRGALLSREEFDIFTNRGLGSKYRFTTMKEFENA